MGTIGGMLALRGRLLCWRHRFGLLVCIRMSRSMLGGCMCKAERKLKLQLSEKVFALLRFCAVTCRNLTSVSSCIISSHLARQSLA